MESHESEGGALAKAAEPFTTRRPTTRGLSPTRLARMHDTLRRHVDSGRLPGLVALISRRGEEHSEAIGTLAFDRTAPMRRDTIFRLDHPVPSLNPAHDTIQLRASATSGLCGQYPSAQSTTLVRGRPSR